MSDATILTADFPSAIRGYSRIAVDDFVRQMGERVFDMQTELDEKTELNERLSEQLEKANSDLTAFIAKETALANALVSIENRRVEVEHEIEIAREDAKAQALQIVNDARADAEAILAETARSAEEVRARAEASCRDQEERLRRLCAQYDDMAMQIRRTLEAHMALLPSPGALLAELSAAGLAVTQSPVENNLENTAEAA